MESPGTHGGSPESRRGNLTAIMSRVRARCQCRAQRRPQQVLALSVNCQNTFLDPLSLVAHLLTGIDAYCRWPFAMAALRGYKTHVPDIWYPHPAARISKPLVSLSLPLPNSTPQPPYRSNTDRNSGSLPGRNRHDRVFGRHRFTRIAVPLQ